METLDQAGAAARKARLSTLAKADAAALKALWAAYAVGRVIPEVRVIRPAEVGTVMVRGRTGGTGSAFNLGEMTVTRTAVQLADGTVGHGHSQGRDREAAHAIAMIDALAQAGEAEELDRAIVVPLREAHAEDAAVRARKAAATKVDFFTMVRGE